MSRRSRNLVLVLGDQLNHDSAALQDFDASVDRIWMAENQEEASHVWCHKYRLVSFFAPMRHFREELRANGFQVDYHELPSDGRKARKSSFSRLLRETFSQGEPQKVVVVHPGDDRVLRSLQQTTADCGVPMEVREDEHFYCSIDRFREWAADRKSMVLESFYRTMRKEHDVLIDSEGEPIGGSWNFDKENRSSFKRGGPGEIPEPPRFAPDAITRDVMEMVSSRFSDHPGELDDFDLPVTRDQAVESLEDFVRHRLPDFGTYQDAMWGDQRFLYHSRLSHAINLHLLSPREVVEAAVGAFQDDIAPINAVEGFVRQILGWREYVRGVYWTQMPEYAELNALQCDPSQGVPDFFWDGQTEMACVADSMRLVMETAYAHHIQRLMVLGLYAQLLGVHPRRFHEWHLAMYADAIDWVSLPNALGMSQYGDGGLMATKPYCASGAYINRMSNHCRSCRYSPKEAVGEDACPFTTLYWDFLQRHRSAFAQNPRMKMQLMNLDRKDAAFLSKVRERAGAIQSGELPV
ncbi:cryptochrome/photolyase family protein [Roseiconus nitratireducens]|uniref:Cryptochrome/photolyase family protein n=1 Tax=Roseiconus nitratireducens TaxID=2605748 RepID=A0A5M6DBM3_9BACT|nr:cryptochrome/photolyase family protein [Roseiconus nitratireducens]KAA5543800.1 cryptochrome/photolyase family protein [Roseiconus nitratireducens]